jgi:hypothetical protein
MTMKDLPSAFTSCFEGFALTVKFRTLVIVIIGPLGCNGRLSHLSHVDCGNVAHHASNHAFSLPPASRVFGSVPSRAASSPAFGVVPPLFSRVTLSPDFHEISCAVGVCLSKNLHRLAVGEPHVRDLLPRYFC